MFTGSSSGLLVMGRRFGLLCGLGGVVGTVRPCRYGELRGLSRLGPLGRLVIKVVEAASM